VPADCHVTQRYVARCFTCGSPKMRVDLTPVFPRPALLLGRPASATATGRRSTLTRASVSAAYLLPFLHAILDDASRLIPHAQADEGNFMKCL
jgi:hypothetical protein